MKAPALLSPAPPRPALAPLAPPARTVPFLAPELPPLELLQQDFARIYSARTFSNGGPFERELAARLADYLGVAHAVPVANATLGLMLALKAVALPGRTRVLVPSFTFAASALAVEWCGLTPVLCDVEPDGWQADPRVDADALAARVPELAAVLVCNTFGAPADLGAWDAWARHHGVPLVVDSASGVGATYTDGRRQGQSGWTEVFSLHATKPFAVGEGGLVTTDDAALAERLARMRNFGFDGARVCHESGFNAKLPEMTAAIGCRVLDGYPAVVAHRRARAALYRERLLPVGVGFQRHGEHSAYQFVPVRLPAGVDVAEARHALARAGVETRTYFAPVLHAQPHFAAAERLGALATTEALSPRMLSLPMSNRLSEDDVHHVCDVLAAFLAERG